MSRLFALAQARREARRRERRIASLVATQMVVVMPTLINLLNQNNDINNNNTGDLAQPPPRCTFKHFNSCKPVKFTGAEGAAGLLQWFEGMENTFVNSGCPKELQVQYATSVFQKEALTWWNTEKRNRGTEVALAMTWEELKTLMTRKFYPRSSIRKLEDEFWELKQDSGENLAYTNRFHELRVLVPHLANPEFRAIEKYIDGLPPQIQDIAFGSKPANLEEAIETASQLTETHVKRGTLFRKGVKESTDHSTTSDATTSDDVTSAATTTSEQDDTATSESSHTTSESPPSTKKRKNDAQDYNIAIPATPIRQVPFETLGPNKRPYAGSYPACDICTYHHPTNSLCRICTNCGRYGHYARTCRLAPNLNTNRDIILYQTAANQAADPVQVPRYNYGQCFECGDPNHYRNQCPRRTAAN